MSLASSLRIVLLRPRVICMAAMMALLCLVGTSGLSTPTAHAQTLYTAKSCLFVSHEYYPTEEENPGERVEYVDVSEANYDATYKVEVRVRSSHSPYDWSEWIPAYEIPDGAVGEQVYRYRYEVSLTELEGKDYDLVKWRVTMSGHPGLTIGSDRDVMSVDGEVYSTSTILSYSGECDTSDPDNTAYGLVPYYNLAY
jgi:hypothetical protein